MGASEINLHPQTPGRRKVDSLSEFRKQHLPFSQTLSSNLCLAYHAHLLGLVLSSYLLRKEKSKKGGT
jgi:hypothetical protein